MRYLLKVMRTGVPVAKGYAAHAAPLAIHITTKFRVQPVSCRDLSVIGLCFRAV